MMRVLEGRAEAVAGTMRMGREPGAGMMRVLEGRAVANTLWAFGG